MLHDRKRQALRLLIPIVISIGAWAYGTPRAVEAATCGDYLHTAKDTARGLAAQSTDATSRSNSHAGTSKQHPPCSGPRCRQSRQMPVAPSSAIRTGPLHEPLLAAFDEFQLSHQESFLRIINQVSAAEGYPCRIKRPPRIEGGILS
jgi:hypothetical protein